MPLFDINALFSDNPVARQTEKSTSAVERFEKMHSEKFTASNNSLDGFRCQERCFSFGR